MSKIWSTMLVLSILVAIFVGNPDTVINSIINSGKSAIENVISLIGLMCFWSGIFNIFEKTSAIKSYQKFLVKQLDFYLIKRI